MNRDEAKAVIGMLMERWPSGQKWTTTFQRDWLAWLADMQIDLAQADACLRQCSADGMSPLLDSHRPKIIERLRACGRRAQERVNRETGEVTAECGTCLGGRQVRIGDRLPLRYVACPTCRGTGVAA